MTYLLERSIVAMNFLVENLFNVNKERNYVTIGAQRGAHIDRVVSSRSSLHVCFAWIHCFLFKLNGLLKMAPKKATTTVRRSVRVAKRTPVSINNDNVGSATETSVNQNPTERRAAKVVGSSRHVVVESRKATEAGITRGVIGKVRTKATSSAST